MFGFSNWRPALMAATFIVLLPGAMAESVRIPYAPPVLPIPDLIKSSVSEIRILDKQGQLVKKFTDRGKTIYSYEQGRRIAAVSDDGRIGLMNTMREIVLNEAYGQRGRKGNITMTNRVGP